MKLLLALSRALERARIAEEIRRTRSMLVLGPVQPTISEAETVCAANEGEVNP